MSDSTQFIRVRQVETGHELTVPLSHAEATGGYEVLDKPAVDAAGDPLPAKYRTTVSEASKQGSRRRSQTPAAPVADSQPPTDGHQAETPPSKKENA